MMMYHEYNIISIIIIMMYHIICIHIHILLHYFIISLIIVTHHFCLIVPYRNVVGHALRFLSNYSPKSSFDHLIAAGYRFLVNHVTGNRRVHLFDRSSTVLRYSILYAAPNLRWVFRKENTVGNYHCYITLQATIRNLRLSPIHLQLPLLRALLLWDFLKKVKNKPRWNT